MQKLRHVPGKPLRPPNAAQCGGSIGLQEISTVYAIVGTDSAGQDMDIGGSEVETLGAGGWHRMGGVAGEKQPAVLHRLADEAAQGDDPLLKDLAFLEPEAVARNARMQFGPNPVVRPVV